MSVGPDRAPVSAERVRAIERDANKALTRTEALLDDVATHARAIAALHWVPVPDDLFAAVLDLCPREDREGQVFAGLGADRLRTAIGRACRDAGVPVFSPHDLRHRRISLWHRHGVSWAEIGSWVGQRSLSVTADTYTHVLADDREVDRTAPR